MSSGCDPEKAGVTDGDELAEVPLLFLGCGRAAQWTVGRRRRLLAGAGGAAGVSMEGIVRLGGACETTRVEGRWSAARVLQACTSLLTDEGNQKDWLSIQRESR